jgi:hypothetical protein
MITHDPRQVIEDIRNHLATHDRRLAFLFGAGTSSAVNIAPAPVAGEKPRHKPLIPDIAGLTELCGNAVGDMGKIEAAAWTTLVKQCEQDGCSANVENVLSKVRMKIDAIGEEETLVGLNRAQLCKLENTICGSIAKTVNPPEGSIPERTPHDDFAVWAKKVNRTAPIEIFTTNYDVLFERAFEAARVPVFDGFVGTYHPFFYPECLDDDELLFRSRNGFVCGNCTDRSIGFLRTPPHVSGLSEAIPATQVSLFCPLIENMTNHVSSHMWLTWIGCRGS